MNSDWLLEVTGRVSCYISRGYQRRCMIKFRIQLLRASVYLFGLFPSGTHLSLHDKTWVSMV